MAMSELFETLIISLNREVQRKNAIASMLNNIDVKYSFIEAVDGREMNALDYFRYAKNMNYKFNKRHMLSPSEVGCRLSHRNAIKEFINNSDSSWLLVLEDDAILPYDFKLNLVNIINSVATHREPVLIHLGGVDGLNSFKRVVKFKDNLFDMNVYKIFNPTVRWLYRTCAYILNEEAARLLLDVHGEYNFAADDWTFILRKSGVKHLRFANLVSHPLDMNLSSIEEERNM